MLFKACPLLLASISAFPADFDWETWKLEHNKHYSTADLETEKYEIFKNNRNFVNNHNSLFSEGHESYSVKINKFADLTNEEFAEKYLTAVDSDSIQKPDWEREEDNYSAFKKFGAAPKFGHFLAFWSEIFGQKFDFLKLPNNIKPDVRARKAILNNRFFDRKFHS